MLYSDIELISKEIKVKNKSAFTLIELLVVIAIIAILAAILFPVFAQAREKARQASCLSNAKQTSLAVQMYIQDYDESFPNAQPGGWQWTESWLVHVQPYIKSFQVLLCPSDSVKRPDWSGPAFSYPANGVVCFDWRDAPTGWKVIGVMSARQNWWTNWDQTMSLGGVGRPSETILTGERYKVTPEYNLGGDDNRGAWDLNTVAFLGWTFDIPGQGLVGQWGKPTNDPGTVAVQHSKQSTFSFVDGHVKSMNPISTIDSSAYSNQNCDSGFYKMWDATRQ